MLSLRGAPALSDFRLSKLNDRLTQSLGVDCSVYAEFLHFIDSDGDISEDDLSVLNQLLEYGPSLSAHQPEGILLLVAPRSGAISPWSSKSTDIARNCGLKSVKRIERAVAYYIVSSVLSSDQLQDAKALLHDRMTEVVFDEVDQAIALFAQAEPKVFSTIDILTGGEAELNKANISLGLALSSDEIEYLVGNFKELGRNPTDAELMMFAQANSEHCRHKIFNAEWAIDGKKQDETLFGMIRNTTNKSPENVLSAYKDNASVMSGHKGQRYYSEPETGIYQGHDEDIHILMKVETHNHPTAISPEPGAATGSGGEIRDEGATGKGSKPKAGLCGFSVSNLKLPNAVEPWETDFGKPSRIVSALDIMLEGPIGAAAFNNEFGRPNLCGYFRTYEEKVPVGENGAEEELRGYHKPIMLAGGLGNIKAEHIEKGEFPAGSPLVVLGGPAMLIGLGGGAASSMTSGSSAEDLDFASVQRANPEMERRCQEVIDRCWSHGNENPILFIHDVGAGGLSNALPELVDDGNRGGDFELRKVNNDDLGMAPMEIWCNESQERYVMAVDENKLDDFIAICERERCPFAVVGTATDEKNLVLNDQHFENKPIDMPLSLLLGKPPKMFRDVTRRETPGATLNLSDIELKEAVFRVLHLPTVANKTFLISIGDRSITGMVARDQMVGPWQVPVADVAVTASDYSGYYGEAMALGERTPIALLSGPASGRMAIGESITNIAASHIAAISDIQMSANWMAAAGHKGEDANLFDTVKAVGIELCPELGISIPVGKDSMSMKSVWDTDGQSQEMIAPLSLIITAFAPVQDIRKTLTPQLRIDKGDTQLILIDLGEGANRLGASALAQVYKQLGSDCPDLNHADLLKGFFAAIQSMNNDDLLLAYHDRSDGGLLVTLSEMAFAGRCGLDVDLSELDSDALAVLFNEELGAVVQIKASDRDQVLAVLADNGLANCSTIIGQLNDSDQINITHGSNTWLTESRVELQQAWSQTTLKMQTLRDNPECAEEEFARISSDDAGLSESLTFDKNENISAPYLVLTKPKVAVLREQGVNGQIEMAAAFDKAGFEPIDVHMSDILSGRLSLDEFKGLVACGGFSYGDVLGAGEGWAKSILFNEKVREMFSDFFNRDDSFSLGICNGCQMLSNLKELIPGTEHWPHFVRNRSEQFEARFVLTEVQDSSSIMLSGMAGSKMPIAVAHGEGRAEFKDAAHLASANALSVLRYVENNGEQAVKYPANPNGSPDAIAGLTSKDGRTTIMMPHPERVIRSVTNSWHPDGAQEDGPWMRLFRNARVWVD